jgi:hypothetical protein
MLLLLLLLLLLVDWCYKNAYTFAGDHLAALFILFCIHEVSYKL